MTERKNAAGIKTRTVRAGFIPLLDCAVLVVAAELGFAHREGINLQLTKEVSWANIRDKVLLEHFDCAQMLAGMPIASALGIGHVKVEVIAPFAFGQGGNAVTVSNKIHDAMNEFGPVPADDPMQTGKALKKVIEHHNEKRGDALTFGIVFPFSSHNYELRYWMAAAGIDPDRDVRLVVIPPPLMADSLKAGHIDGFCVGEPWSSVAVRDGLGHIIVTKQDIWSKSPEKVLGMLPQWRERNPETVQALLRALVNAAHWADQPENRAQLARLLSSENYVNVDPDILEASLSGNLQVAPDGKRRRIDGFLKFSGPNNNLPGRDHALWLYSQMVRWGQTPYSAASEVTVRNIVPPPGSTEGMTESDEACPRLFDGYLFTPNDLPGYINGFKIKTTVA